MRLRWWTAAAVLLPLVGLAGLFWLGRGGAPAPGSVSPAPASPPGPSVTPSRTRTATPGATTLPPISFEEGQITGSDPAGRLQWELRAASFETAEARQEIRLRRVLGKFYERGVLVVTVTAETAVYSMEAQVVTLTGGVRARAGDRVLEADRVQWLAARRLLVATGNVRLLQDRLAVHADRLESDIGLRRTKLSGNIVVTVRE